MAKDRNNSFICKRGDLVQKVVKANFPPTPGNEIEPQMPVLLHLLFSFPWPDLLSHLLTVWLRQQEDPMKTRQLDVTQHPCGHSASMRTSLGQTVAPSLLLGPSTAQWKMKVNVSGTLWQGSRGQGSVGQGRTSPYWPDLLLLILSLKSEAVPPRRVSRHSSLIGRGFGLDKVSEMTSTMHFIT